MSLIHLHLNSICSLLDGLNQIKPPEETSNALMLTDRGMSGSLDCYLECKKQTIKPVSGVEVYLRPAAKHIVQPEVRDRATNASAKPPREIRGAGELAARLKEISLAYDHKIVHAGEDVAGIAAEIEEILDDALRAIVVKYKVLPCATTIKDALGQGAPAAEGAGAGGTGEAAL